MFPFYFGRQGVPVQINSAYPPCQEDEFFVDKHAREISVTDALGKTVLMIKAWHMSSDFFKMSILSEVNQVFPDFHFVRGEPQDWFSHVGKDEPVCFFNHTKNPVAEICFDDRNFHLKVMEASEKEVALDLYGDRFPIRKKLGLEAPKAYTLEEAIERALKSNLNSRAAFEKVLQARLQVTANTLNLLPHLSASFLWNANPRYITAIAPVQALAPFLLPSSWTRAWESQWDLLVQRDARIILRADLASIVEQLALAWDRDQQLLTLQVETYNVLKTKLGEGQILKAADPELKGPTAYRIRKQLSAMEADIERLGASLKEDQYALSLALGYLNPKGVEKVTVPPFKMPTRPLPLYDAEDIADKARRRSFELRQLDSLAKVRRLNRAEYFVNWIDPSGDPKSGFGLNTFPQLTQATSKLHELGVRAEAVNQSLYFGSFRVVDQYNTAAQAIFPPKPLKTLTELSQRIDEKMKVRSHRRSIFPMVRRYLARQSKDIATVTEYRIAKSKIDRLLLGGVYIQLLPDELKETPDQQMNDSAPYVPKASEPQFSADFGEKYLYEN